MLISKRILRSHLYFWITNRIIEEWINSKNIFFILCIGRTGTAFFADLLNKSPGSFVVQEPFNEDFSAYKQAFFSEKKATQYVQRFRKKEIYLCCFIESVVL